IASIAESEIRAHREEARVLGRVGRSSDGWVVRGEGMPVAYEPERINQAMIRGYLQGSKELLRLRMGADGDPRMERGIRSYLSGYRYLLKGWAASLEMPYEEPPMPAQSKLERLISDNKFRLTLRLDRLKAKLDQRFRTLATLEDAYYAGWKDAFYSLPPAARA